MPELSLALCANAQSESNSALFAMKVMKIGTINCQGI